MEQRITILVKDETSRIDRLITAELEDFSRSAVQNLLKQGRVTKGGSPLRKNQRLHQGDEITVRLPAPQALDLLPQEMPLEICYEDQELLVVNKPKGMVVHPAPGHPRDTLVNALLHHCGDSLSGINGVQRPGIVHRIDKDTSGLLMVAKNDFAHRSLAEQIQEHSFRRIYEGVVYGTPKEQVGTIRTRIGRSPKDRKKMAVLPEGSHAREAVTHYRLIRSYKSFSHLQLTLETGRTHQIRVHMAYLGHPLAGDPVYGPKPQITALEGQCLHAGTLGFCHPRSGKWMEFSAPVPVSFQKFLSKC